MKQLSLLFLCLVVLPPWLDAQTDSTLKTERDKVSYIIGTDIGKNLKKQGIEVDPELMFKGFKDGYSDNKLLLSDSAIQECMTSFQQEMMAKQSEVSAKLAEKNKADGEAFLAANKKRDSVVTLPSGLQYKILVKGKGKSPKLEDTVTAHYRGMLIDGTEFDNSYKRGEPLTIPVNGVIPGWTEALQHMTVGSKWQLFIPSELAYGERGAGQIIGPNATLIFDVELLSIK
ncbi:MAG TPA: FKBP-type peptidyl-prolyl cis-trans isomerase [Bacteroidota bacterium]|nr:FKBP-type peptidyl-prolyl cis-trans isomerase [Bacteroidota bacterium]